MAIKVVAALLLIGSASTAYNLATTPFTAFPLIGSLMILFVAFLVLGALLMLIY